MMNAWAVITGASAGIGEATAKELSRKGYNLILVARRKERLEKLKAQIEASCRSRVEIASIDITDPKQIESFVQTHSHLLKDLEVLVNNAGLAKGTDKMQDARTSDWDDMIETNIKGLLHFTRAILPFFVAKQKGHIVNLGSVAGRWTYPGGGVYAATKFAVRAISEGLRMDLLGKHIRVTNIEPGMVQTDFSLVRLGSKEKADAVYAGMKPLTAEDIAETISWVVSRPAHVNIQEVVIYPTDQASVRDVHRT
jgi:3-hydroxy acid dehydrogenase/malonic semialdehyde reductase